MSARPSDSWPDWSGQTAVIVATGPSAATAPLPIAKFQARFIAIKNSWKLCPWADALYGCDKDWWIFNRGVPEFAGMKFSPSPTVCRLYRDIRLVQLKSRAQILLAKPGVIGCGLSAGNGHSGFQAINLAVQWGVKRIVLVGFDMTLAHGAHWHKEQLGFAKPDALRVAGHCREMDACAQQFTALGVEVVNASEHSALKAYPKLDFAEAFNGGEDEDRPNQS